MPDDLVPKPGTTVNVEISEGRVFEIMDGLVCDRMDRYFFVDDEQQKAKGFIKLPEGEQSKRNTTKVQRRMAKRLRTFCEETFSEHEDRMVSALMDSDGRLGPPLLLLLADICMTRTGACSEAQMETVPAYSALKKAIKEPGGKPAKKAKVKAKGTAAGRQKSRERAPTEEELEGISAVPGN